MAVVWGDLEEVSEGSYLLFTQAALCCKMIAFIVKKDKVRELLEFIDKDEFAPQCEEHEKILLSHSNMAKTIYMGLVISYVANCTEWALIPVIENVRMYPFKIWMPINPEKSPNYELAYTYQVIAVYISPAVFFAIDITIVCMMMFGCAQLDIIMDKTRKIQRVPTSLKPSGRKELLSDNKKLLIECISQHQNVIRFINLVEDTFHITMFLQLSGTVAIICIIGFRISVEPPNTFHFYSTLNYLISIMAQLFLFCWCGNELTRRSEEVREWLYLCPWEDQDVKFGRILVVAMECMKRPIVYTAGHYISLSRPTFVSILRCSYSYFAVLNQANTE